MPRRKSSVVDDLILAPWWISAALALLAFVVLPAALPASSSWAPMISFLLLAIAVVSALRGWANRAMLEKQTGIDSIRELPWKQFEDLLGEAYRRQGYSVTETLGGGADGGVDLVLSRNGDTTLVQCKLRTKRPIPVQTVRELYGVLADRGATAAKLVATTNFTADALAFARGKPIELVNAESLLKLIRSVQTSGKMPPPIPENASVIEAPQCPQCDSSMVLREARRGAKAGQSFWGCSRYPACHGTRDV